MWSAIDCPTLLIRGSESHVLPSEMAAEMVDWLPGTRLLTIEGVGHDILLHRPGELASRLDAFAGELERGCA